MRYVVVFLGLFLMVGCSEKQVDIKAENEKMLNFGMTHSKKIEMIESATQAKTLVSITYLQPIKHELVDKTKEQFIVGVYHMNGVVETDKASVGNFTINQIPKEQISVTPLAANSPLLSLVSSSNPWTEYLLVETPKTDKLDMVIGFENGQSVKASATFRKDY